MAEAKVGWVWDTSNRSSFDILWSCLAVILVCTYKVVHLNLPAYREAEASWHQVEFWSKWGRKLKWMGFMSVAPEMLLSMALQDWLWSRESVRNFRRSALNRRSFMPESCQAMTTVIESINNLEMAPAARSMPSRVPLNKWTKVHAHYANMGGFIMKFPNKRSSGHSKSKRKNQDALNKERIDVADEAFCHQPVPLFAAQLLMLMDEFSVEIPYRSPEDIRDRSKADVFTKLFAIGQSSWLIIQCIARAAQGLPITELELATMGFVGCALLMYLLWWDKPFDVEHPVAINCPYKDRQQVIERLKEMFEARNTSKFISPEWKDVLQEQRIRNWAYLDESSLGLGHGIWLLNVIAIMAVGMSFSALQLAAWKWAFPSTVEAYLWRTAALIATGACISVTISLPLLGIGSKPWQRYVILGFIFPLCGLYILCRTVLLIQVFICFRATPESVYKTTDWAYFLPHIA